MPRRTTSWSSTSITRIGLLSSVAVTAVLPRRRWRDGGAEGCCRSLASGAVMAGESLMHGSSDQSSAPGAQLTVAPVDDQRPGEVPGLDSLMTLMHRQSNRQSAAIRWDVHSHS